METYPEYVGDISIRCAPRPDDVLEVNHSLLAQCEIDSLRSEIIQLRRERNEATAVADELSEIAGATLGWYLAQKDIDLSTIDKITSAIKRWKELK